MPINELQNFRSKYPQYNDMSDIDLATKLASKHPEYSDVLDKVKNGISPEDESKLRQQVFEEKHPIMSSIERTAGIPARFANEMALGWPMYAAKKAGATFPENDTTKIPNAAASMGGFIFNPVMQTVGKANPIAGLGWSAALHAPSDAVKTPIDLIKEKAVDVPMSMILPKAIDKTAEGIMNIPKASGDIGARIHDYIIKLPKGAFNYSKDPLSVLKKEKIQANTITDYVDKSKDLLNKRTSELNDAISNSNKNVDIGSVVDENLQNATRSLKGSLKDRSSDLSDMDVIVNNLKSKYGDLSNLTVQKAIKLKRQIADDFPFTNENSTDVIAKSMHKIYRGIDEAIDAAHPEIADLNHRVSGLIDIHNAAKNRMIVDSRSNPIGLIGTILGTATGAHFGGFGGGVEAGIGTALAMKALSSPAVLTRVANVLSGLSEVEKVNVFKAYPFLKSKISEFSSKELNNVNFGTSYKSLPEQQIMGENPIKGLPSPLNNPVLKKGEVIKGEGFTVTGGALRKGGVKSSGYELRTSPDAEPMHVYVDKDGKHFVYEGSKTNPTKRFLGNDVSEAIYKQSEQSATNEPLSQFNPLNKQGEGMKGAKALGLGAGIVVGGMLLSPASAQASQTLGMKNNNPINLKAFQSWDGMSGKDKYGHAQFKTLDHGIRAAVKNLKTHQRKNPSQSLKDYLSTFAEANSQKEAEFIAKSLGVSPKASLASLNMEDVLIPLARFESKTTITKADIARVKKKFNLR